MPLMSQKENKEAKLYSPLSQQQPHTLGRKPRSQVMPSCEPVAVMSQEETQEAKPHPSVSQQQMWTRRRTKQPTCALP